MRRRKIATLSHIHNKPPSPANSQPPCFHQLTNRALVNGMSSSHTVTSTWLVFPNLKIRTPNMNCNYFFFARKHLVTTATFCVCARRGLRPHTFSRQLVSLQNKYLILAKHIRQPRKCWQPFYALARGAKNPQPYFKICLRLNLFLPRGNFDFLYFCLYPESNKKR